MPVLRHRPRDLIQGRYEVRRLLGSGAFGTVYGCLDTELQTPVAVKEMHALDEPERLRSGGGERAQALKQFREEAIHLSKLNHPHIVRGHYERDQGAWRVCPVCGLDFPLLRECPDHGAALLPLDARHYLVMEYVGGPDLLSRAEHEGGRLHLDEALRWMEQIASALGHVHGRGFVHRDIKPENVRLREGDEGEAVLLDFGIASQEGATTGDRYGTRPRRATLGGGTLGYAPPTPQEAEQPDARSDIYAFGMTWYHLLCGLDPTEPTQEARMKARSPREFRSDIPRWLDELLRECIHSDPDQRPQNGSELLERLESGHDAPAFQLAPDPAPGMAPGQATPAGTTILSPPFPAPSPAPASQSAPLLFRSGHYARDLSDLVWLCDEFPDEAAKRLADGEIERWLRAQGNETLARAAANARGAASRRAGLETFVQATGLAEPPRVGLSPTQLDFGSLGREERKTLSLKMRRSGRGWLFGSVTTSAGALSTPGAFEGESVEIPFTFDAFRLRPGRYDGQIHMNGSMGQLSVPWTARVRGPSLLVPFLVVVANGVFGMIAGGALRSVPFLATHQQHLNWLRANSFEGWTPGFVFGGVFALCWFVWTLGFSLFRRSCGTLMSLLLLGTLVSLYTLFMGGSWLIGGDALLKPHLQPIVHGFAAGGWMYAGATLGALAGALWRWRDLASNRFWTVFAGFFTTLLLVTMALEGARGGLR